MTAAVATSPARRSRRTLDHYPETGTRARSLGIVVLVTIVLYYQLYVAGAVATAIITELDMSLRYFILIFVIGNAIGAVASLAAGLADRWGRASIVTYGLLVTGLLVTFGLPNAHDKTSFLVMFAAVSAVEGVVLVATPALVRDFSPQLGRASAMGFWTLGPVIGSLVVTEVSSHTLAAHPEWQFQFRLAGGAGLVVFVIAFLGLRELSPRLRDQLMVSLRDRALIEARAADIDPEAALAGHWRQMLRLDVVGSAAAIGVFLLFYYVAVGFFVVYFSTTFGYSAERANAVANWYWIGNAVSLAVGGVLSDLVRVRKPFMLVGGVISAVGVAIFAVHATDPTTGYYTFAFTILLIALGSGMAYSAWMASFTETVERHNPAATATGLAIWGAVIRVIITASLTALIFAVSSSSVLVDQGPKVQALATRYAPELSTIARIRPATLAALQRDPADRAAQVAALADLSGLPAAEVAALAAAPPAVPGAAAQSVQQAVAELTAVGQVPAADLAYLQEHGPEVQAAAAATPYEWQRWWWICFAGQIVFLPSILLMSGRWSPRRAREDAAAHDAAVAAELAALQRTTA